jgi:hypothetical protein
MLQLEKVSPFVGGIGGIGLCANQGQGDAEGEG